MKKLGKSVRKCRQGLKITGRTIIGLLAFNAVTMDADGEEARELMFYLKSFKADIAAGHNLDDAEVKKAAILAGEVYGYHGITTSIVYEHLSKLRPEEECCEEESEYLVP